MFFTYAPGVRSTAPAGGSPLSSACSATITFPIPRGGGDLLLLPKPVLEVAVVVRGNLGRSSLEDEEEEDCLSLKPLNEDEEDACPSLTDPRAPLEAYIVKTKKSTIPPNSNYFFPYCKPTCLTPMEGTSLFCAPENLNTPPSTFETPAVKSVLGGGSGGGGACLEIWLGGGMEKSGGGCENVEGPPTPLSASRFCCRRVAGDGGMPAWRRGKRQNSKCRNNLSSFWPYQRGSRGGVCR